MDHPSTPAGWYPQPDKTMRYWDGSAWTDDVHKPGVVKPVVYEGIRWVGIRWGRTGKSTLPRVSAVIFALMAVTQLLMAIRDSFGLVHTGLAIASAFVAVTFWIDGHFAARVSREQQPQAPTA